MKRRVITLLPIDRQKLESIRGTHTKPYVRERAAAILKIADGNSISWVAKHGLLEPRDRAAVTRWVNSYLKNGVNGLCRKEYKHPNLRSGLSTQQEKELKEMLHRPPHLFMKFGSRWTLDKIRTAFPSLCDYSLSGIWRLLRRLDIAYKRGRLHITSPDIHYNEKKQWIQEAQARAHDNPDEVVTLFGDEKTYRRVPVASCSAYGDRGTSQPTAKSTPGSNTQRRIGGVVNVVDGSVWYIQRSRLGVKALMREMYEVGDWIHSSHPLIKEINLIWDCWPVHFHPDVMLAAHRAGITLIPLPTYSPWENPIEKLWRWLCQEVLHMHHYSAAWHALWKMVEDFLDQFAHGSQELLQYVGLLL